MNIIPGIVFFSLNALRKFNTFSDAVLSGFWLGVLSERNIELYSDLHYSRGIKYIDDSYNLSGLSKWEYNMIKKHFSDSRTFLLLAAGGGRETAILRKWGVEVDSYECSQKFVNYGNEFLQRNQLSAKIEYLPKNAVPAQIKKYDGIILGWGAYTHIQSRENRISFLQKLHPYCKNNTPIMLSFQTRNGTGRRYTITTQVSNFFRHFAGRKKSEPGDILYSYFAHQFVKEEIESELNLSGFRMIDYYDVEYGCAIATSNEQQATSTIQILDE